MAEASSRSLFTGEQVLSLLDSGDEEDFGHGLDEVFFPGSDDELGFEEEEIYDEKYVKSVLCTIHTSHICYAIVMLVVEKTTKTLAPSQLQGMAVNTLQMSLHNILYSMVPFFLVQTKF